MKKSVIAVSIMSALLFAGWAGAADSATSPQKQTVCPVMGNPVNKSLFVDYEGKRIYVCCKGCLPKVKEYPAKYIQQLEGKGITLDKATTNAGQAAPAQGHDHAGPKAGGHHH